MCAVENNIIKKIEILKDNSLYYNNNILKMVRQIGQGKSGKVYLYEGDGFYYAVKIYEYEVDNIVINPVPLEEILNFEVNSYNILKTLEISIPLLIAYDSSNQILIKEFIEGPNLIDIIALNKVHSNMFQEIFKISNCVSSAGYNIDYFPANFIFYDDKMWYVDYEVNHFDEEWSFENWGIYYWLNPEGVKNFLQTRNGDFINKPGTVKPYDDKEKRILRDAFLNKYKV